MLHYIVSVYTGVRQNKFVNEILANDPSHYVKIHLERLRLYGDNNIQRVTFVISPSSDPERDRSVMEYASSVDLGFAVTDSYIKENNKYFSYGCWEDCVRRNMGGLDFFLIEDDYFPAVKGFYEPFVNGLNSKEGVAYSCQWYKNRHAAISNGVLSVKAAKKHIEEFGESLLLSKFDAVVYPPEMPEDRDRIEMLYIKKNSPHQQRRPLMKQRSKPISIKNMPPPGFKVIHPGVFAQERFLQGYEALGYSFVDLMDEYMHPFLSDAKTVKEYGKKGGKVLIDCDFYKQ